MKKILARNLRKVVTQIMIFYEKEGRHSLPWRKTKNPYFILVSEVMLQQTQVDRVIPYYQAFIKRFPSIETLANASLKDVLSLWQGLGYNRRARMLHESARTISELHKNNIPNEYAQLISLPGVGSYTARAILVFAFSKKEVLIETNIRTVLIHSFFNTSSKKSSISDRVLEPILTHMTEFIQNPRDWNYALMDYGAHLKRSGVRTNMKVHGYVKQKPFEGSMRQARGTILRALSLKPRTRTSLISCLGKEREPQMKKALDALFSEGFIVRNGRTFSLKDS